MKSNKKKRWDGLMLIAVTGLAVKIGLFGVGSAEAKPKPKSQLKLSSKSSNSSVDFETVYEEVYRTLLDSGCYSSVATHELAQQLADLMAQTIASRAEKNEIDLQVYESVLPATCDFGLAEVVGIAVQQRKFNESLFDQLYGHPCDRSVTDVGNGEFEGEGWFIYVSPYVDYGRQTYTPMRIGPPRAYVPRIKVEQALQLTLLAGKGELDAKVFLQIFDKSCDFKAANEAALKAKE